ncbi:hypothetical protein ACT3UJ_06625 [Halomonas sp. 86]|uniref:hypothetical protein n=1 Tax=unclassified Halomonas TaxID=2609666 RepID=UPI004033B9F0
MRTAYTKQWLVGAALLAGASLVGCQTVPESAPELDLRDGWVVGTSGYCVLGHGQRSSLKALAGWQENYAEEDYHLLGGLESTVVFWGRADVEHTWAISELHGYITDRELIQSRENSSDHGPVTCVAPSTLSD